MKSKSTNLTPTPIPFRRVVSASDLWSHHRTYVAGDSWLIASVEPDFVVTVILGRATEPQLRSVLAVAEPGLAGAAPPVVWLLDDRRITGVDAGNFALFTRHLVDFKTLWRRSIVRLACVIPEGFIGAIIEGIVRVAPLPFPARTFRDPFDGIEWLGRSPTVLPELDEIVASICGEDAILSHMRAVLQAARGDITVTEIARRMGLTLRSLQRRLKGAGTSFRRECARARVEAAKELLAQPDRTLVEIALEAGFASSQHFSETFRRFTGETPGRWRRRFEGCTD